MQSKDIEDDTQASSQQAKESGDLRPAWIRSLEVTVTQLHSLMPKVYFYIFTYKTYSIQQYLKQEANSFLAAIPKAQAYRTEH